MRSLVRYLFAILILLIVALVSALTAMRVAVHGRQVTVPDVQGKTPSEARRLADEQGLEVQTTRQYYSASVPAGRVLSQMPAPGTLVRRGWELQLALSLGPQKVAIPNVVGESERAAGIIITQRGLELDSEASAQVPGAQPGQVVAQNPAGNATNVSAPKISLLVAQDQTPAAFLMPSFIGQPLGSVTLTLRDAGFHIGNVTVAPAAPDDNAQADLRSPAPAPSPASIIVSQDPTPGAKIVAGSAINFVVR